MMMAISLGLHVLLILSLGVSPRPIVRKGDPMPYTVTLVPVATVSVAMAEPETRFKHLPLPKAREEKERPLTKPKRDDLVERVKKPQETVEKPEEKKPDLRRLQEKLEEVRKKIALEEIERRVASRQKVEKKPIAPLAPVPVVSTAKPSAEMESKLIQYHSLIWAKIKQAWTIPEHLHRGGVDLETVIVVIIENDGSIRKTWFEKKSGNDLYDQMAMRAVKRAEPLPPIPRELGESSLEIGIRFLPD